MAYQSLIGAFIYKTPLFRTKVDALAENDSFLRDNGWAVSTKTLFYQAAVPTGWTQDVSQNDKILRVVGPTGGGVSGGTTGISSTITVAHSHSGFTFEGLHTHLFNNHTHFCGRGTTAGLSAQRVVTDGTATEYFIARNIGGGAVIGEYLLEDYLETPGAVLLGNSGSHNHGGSTASSLTDFVFAYTDVIVGTKDAPAGTYTDLTTYFTTGTKIDFDQFDQLADNDEYNKNKLMPFGTIMVFGQAAASLGWTKIIGTNDKMLRIVSGAGAGSGGTIPPSTTYFLSHTHTITAEPDHTHSIANHQHYFKQNANVPNASPLPGASGSYIQESISGTRLALSSSTGTLASRTFYKYKTKVDGSSGVAVSTGGHVHTLPPALADLTFAYLDVIQCSKDSTGAPQVYTNMTAAFAWKKLVSKQRLDKMAQNDEYVKFHTTPLGTKAFFYMASPPSGWTKDTSINDHCLRMVGPTGGGIVGGGSHLVSQAITLSHSHSILPVGDHTHVTNHTHDLDTGTVSTTPPTNNYINAQRSFSPVPVLLQPYIVGGPIGVASTVDKTTAQSIDLTAASGTHNHGGSTNTQLSNVSLAYADVIYCTKD